MNSSLSLRLPNISASEEREGTCEAISLEVQSDEALIAEVCRGSEEGLAILFRRYARVVRAVGLRILEDVSEADDLLQDIFLLIHRLARTFDSSKASVQFWIVQMTYRRAISRRQSLNSRHFYTRLQLDEQLIQNGDSSMGQFDRLIDQRLAELDLQKMFENLSDDQRKRQTQAASQLPSDVTNYGVTVQKTVTAPLMESKAWLEEAQRVTLDIEYRILLPDGDIKHVHAGSRNLCGSGCADH